MSDTQSRPLPPGGKVRAITRWGAPVMHQTLATVEDYNSTLETLVKDMVATMYAAQGVGLAASQVGEDIAVFVFDCPDDDGFHVTGIVCNPVLTLPEGKNRELDDDEEGCLSLPGAYASCPRPNVATVEGTDHLGEPVVFHGTGLLARCLQHETDHLFGMVFGDRVPDRARKKLYKQHQQLAPDYPEDWPIPAE